MSLHHPRTAMTVTPVDAWAMAQERRGDLAKVEAIHIAAERAIVAAGRGQLRESAAGHALLNAIYALTEAREVYDLALEWGAFAGVVRTEGL